MKIHMRAVLHLTLLAVLLPGLCAQAEQAEQSGLSNSIEAIMQAQGIPGVCVGIIRGEDVLYRRAFGMRDLATGEAMTCETLFQVGSVSKTFTATMMAELMEGDLLSLEDPLQVYLPEDLALDEGLAEITLLQLASHSSGLPRNPVNRRDLPDSPGVMLPYSINELYAGLEKTSLKQAPGSRWDYSNLGYAILGHVLEQASGEDYATLLQEKIVGPLALEDTGIYPSEAQEARMATHYWPEDKERQGRKRWIFGEVVGFGGVFSNLDDLASYIRAWYQGEYGPLGLSAETFETLQTPVIPIDANRGRNMSPGWFIDSFPGVGAIIGHGGEVDGHSCCVAYLPEQKAGIIVLANMGGNSAEAIIQVVMQKAMPMMLSR
ncbi:MAG: serine hydrolase domain-containing protein [Planctomycetota bacterium]|jgi:CubicO group peptidase (beta-lactamase class C family)